MGYKLTLTPDARRRIGWRRDKIFTRITKICQVCGKPFETVPSSSKQYTCSRQCQFERMKKPKKELECQFCHKIYTTKSHKKYTRFCSRLCACQFRWQNHINKIRPSDVIIRREMVKCQNCGYNTIPQILERHHKDFNHSNNNHSNLIVLCPTCHDAIHFNSGNGIKFRQSS